MKIDLLKKAASEAAAEAKKLVADEIDGRSPFAASIRASLDHAVELIAAHEKAAAAPANTHPK